MMAAEENWQTKLSTTVEKTAFIFNNELLSDVKFVVSLPNGGGESKKAIPAHKFVLAINILCSSPCSMVVWRRLKTLLNCLTVSTRVCWSYFVSCTATK